MTALRVWALNYDAESELAGAPTSRMPLIDRPPWIRRGEPVLGADDADDAGVGPGTEGIAWCPTPKALAALRAAGVERLSPAPNASVLKAANERGTFADLHPLQGHGALMASTLSEVESAVARAAPERSTGRPPAWLLRRSLGAAGQGRLIAEIWAADVAVWAERALRYGPVHVMPLVDIQEEFSGHAFLGQDGSVRTGEQVVQVVRGAAWVSANRRAQPVPELTAALALVIDRLRAMDYFGPVGVDGFTWRDKSGAQQVAAGTDINARYTMSMGAAFDEVP